MFQMTVQVKVCYLYSIKKNTVNLIFTFTDSSLKSLSDTDSMGKGKRARIPNKRYSDIAITPNRKNTSNQKLSDGSDQETPLKEDPVEPPVSISSPPLPYKKQRFAAVKENLQVSF